MPTSRRRAEPLSTPQPIDSGKALGLLVPMIPANLSFIREKLSRMTATVAGMTEKRFSTVKSQVKFAFRHLGLVDADSYLHPMTGRWLDLWKALPSKYARTALSRFFRYGSSIGIAPDDVTDDVLDQFRTALEAETFIKNPRTLHAAPRGQHFCALRHGCRRDSISCRLGAA